MSDNVSLKPGTILADDYRIERTIGAGGFGITYLAEEIALGRRVTIKEYFPVDFAARNRSDDVVARSVECEGDYGWGLDRFLAEAQTLAKFNHPNIVRVYRYFPARNTGYIVLHFEAGTSFKEWLRKLGRAPRQPEFDRIVEPLLAALETVHAADYLHRDIAPDNIMIRPDGQPVLIDFGSARGEIARHSKTISALVKAGYSPYEQYGTNSRQQGPWTDIYSLGATLYEAVTGRRPPDSPTRMGADEMVPPADAARASYRPRFLDAIAKSLRLEIGERPRTIAEWRAELLAPVEARPRPAKKPARAAVPEPEPSLAAASAVPPPPPPPPPKVVSKPRAAAVEPAAGQVSLLQAFVGGWRKVNEPQPALAGAAPAAIEVAAPPSPPSKRARNEPVARSLPAPDPAPSAPAAASRLPFPFARRTKPTPPPEPGARRATPRAIRKRSSRFGRKVAAYAILALGLAGAAVAVQDYVPTVRREGAGLLTSDVRSDNAPTVLKGHRGSVSGIAYSPDGQDLVTASADGTLMVWSPARGALVRKFELDGGAATALAVAKGRAATGHPDGTVVVLDLATGSKLASFRRNDRPVLGLAFLGRPERLAAAAADSVVTVWDVSQQTTPSRVLEGHEDAARATAYTSRGPFLASGSSDHTVKLWSLDKGELVRTYRGHGEPVVAVTFDAEGRSLASSGSDGQIRLWSTYSSRQRRRLTGHEGSVTALAFMADRERLVSGGLDGTIRIWDTGGKARLVRSIKVGAPVTALGLAPDGRHVAAAGSDGMVRIFDISPAKEGS